MRRFIKTRFFLLVEGNLQNVKPADLESAYGEFVDGIMESAAVLDSTTCLYALNCTLVELRGLQKQHAMNGVKKNLPAGKSSCTG
jgi:hypothetical protein